MSVAIDSFASAQGTSITQLSYSHVLVAGSGNDRIVKVQVASKFSLTNLSVDFDGVAMTFLQSISRTDVRVSEFEIRDSSLPATGGTFTVLANWSGNETVVTISVAYTGVDQSSPFTAVGTSSGFGTGFQIPVLSGPSGQDLIWLAASIDSDGQTDMIERFSQTETVEDATGSGTNDVRSSITERVSTGTFLNIGYDWQSNAGFVTVRGNLQAPPVIEADATVAAAGAVVATALAVKAVDALIAGAGAVVAVAVNVKAVAATIQGVGAVTAEAVRQKPVGATIQGVGSMDGTAAGLMEAEATIVGQANLDTSNATKISAALAEAGWWGQKQGFW